MYIGELIKDYREKNNLSLRVFAERADLSNGYISQLEKVFDPRTGDPIKVTYESMKKIAQAMFISIDELVSILEDDQKIMMNTENSKDIENIDTPIEQEQEKEKSNAEFVTYNKSNLVKMPIIGTIPAGTPIEAIQYIDEDDYLYIPKERLRGGKENYFLLRISGNSMNPEYQDGDVILFYINPTPNSGAEVAVMVNGDDATFKQIFISENGVTLHPYNSLFDDMHYSIEEIRELPVRVLGVAQSLEYRDLRG